MIRLIGPGGAGKHERMLRRTCQCSAKAPVLELLRYLPAS